MRKKLVSMLLTAVILCLTLVATPVFAATPTTLDIEVETVDAKPGDEVTINIYASNVQNVGGFNIDFQYDGNALEIVEFTKGKIFDESMTYGYIDHIKETNLLFASKAALDGWNHAEQGLLLVVKAKVKTDAPVGLATITVNEDTLECVDPDVVIFTPTIVTGGVNVTAVPVATPEATVAPTAVPTAVPTAKPTVAPTTAPTAVPTSKPVATAKPTAEPTVAPTVAPTAKPTTAPTATPVATAKPTAKPTAVPTAKPTAAPTAKPTAAPTAAPVVTPAPTAAPVIVAPTTAPTASAPVTGENGALLCTVLCTLGVVCGASVVVYKKSKKEN